MSNIYYINEKEILDLVKKNALLYNIIFHTRSDKGSILYYNLVIVFFLLIFWYAYEVLSESLSYKLPKDTSLYYKNFFLI